MRATLLDSQRSVQDVKFAPRHLGLKLASASLDGFIRVYEAQDVTNLSHWPGTSSLVLLTPSLTLTYSSLSFTPSPCFTLSLLSLSSHLSQLPTSSLRATAPP